MAAKYRVEKANNGQFFFNLIAANGEIILTSETYVAKQSALVGIQSVKANSPHDQRYYRGQSTNGSHYFHLKAVNNEIIGRSESYKSSQAMETGIQSVKTNGPTAPIDDAS